MSALLNDPFFMLLSAALIGAIGYNIWQVVYRDKAWKQVEAETSLKFEERKKGKNRDQILGGVYHHRKLTLTDTNLPVFRNGKRKSDMLTSASTNVHMALENPKMLKLTLHRTTQIKRLNPIGVEEFDSRFNITCEPEPFAKSLLVSGKLRERLQQLKPGCQIELNENELIYDQTGRLLAADQIISLFDLMCALADTVEGWRA